MLKKISALVLIAFVFVGCSDDKKQEKVTFKEGVHAFIHNNKNVIAYGKVDMQAILTKGKFDSNPMIEAFAGAEIEKLKTEIDMKTPLYYVVEKQKDKKDPRMFFFAKLTDQEKLVKDMKGGKGFVFKEVDGIAYTEDGDWVVGLRDEIAVVIVQGGDYVAADIVKEAFKLTQGDQPDSKMKAQIERSGDITLSLALAGIADEIPSNSPLSASDLKGVKSFTAINFEQGQAILTSEWELPSNVKSKLGLTKSAQPYISEKVVNAEGEVIAAVQVSMTSKVGGIDSANELDRTLATYKALLGMGDSKMTISHFETSEGIRMPDGNKMGSKLMEMFIDFDKLAMSMDMDEMSFVIKELDYATYEVTDNKAKIVVKTHRSGENVLATLIELASGAAMALMGGGNMMI